MPPFSQASVSKVEASRNPGRPKGAPKTGGRKKGTPNKVTKDIREAIGEMLEGCADRMGEWLDRVAAEDPAKALDLALKASEYAIPKLSRAEVKTEDAGLAERLRAAADRVNQLDAERRAERLQMLEAFGLRFGAQAASEAALIVEGCTTHIGLFEVRTGVPEIGVDLPEPEPMPVSAEPAPPPAPPPAPEVTVTMRRSNPTTLPPRADEDEGEREPYNPFH